MRKRKPYYVIVGLNSGGGFWIEYITRSATRAEQRLSKCEDDEDAADNGVTYQCRVYGK